MIQSPKTRFLENKNEVDSLLELTSRAQFLKACDFAMLDVMERFGYSSGSVEATANWYRMEGAKAFRDSLLTLAEQPKPASRVPIGNLNHNV